MLATLLNVAGYAVSPGSVAPMSFAITNRMIAFAVIWIMALLLYRRLELERALAAGQSWYRALLAERALQESHDRYRQLIEASPDAIIVCRDGGIRSLDPGGVVLIGASHEAALIGRPLLEFLPEAEQAQREARTGQPNEPERPPAWTEQRLLRLDAREVDVEVGSVES